MVNWRDGALPQSGSTEAPLAGNYVTVGLIQRNKPHVYLVYPSLRVGEGVLRMTLPDYVAIGVLIVLIVWAAADWVPRGKL